MKAGELNAMGQPIFSRRGKKKAVGGQGSNRLKVGVSGASGMIYAQRFLQKVRARNEVEVHLIVTAQARAIIAHELVPRAGFSCLAGRNYDPMISWLSSAASLFPPGA